jgi:hypothetical protein
VLSLLRCDTEMALEDRRGDATDAQPIGLDDLLQASGLSGVELVRAFLPDRADL